MAQAWHNRRRSVSVQREEALCWRATQYELDHSDGPAMIEAVHDAAWERFAPFDSYRPTSKAREVAPGPHLKFLRLKGLWEEQSDLFHKALILFAEEYGFLGSFEEDYLQRPVLPEGTNLVAPEAMIDSQGRLIRFDPATKGKDLLKSILQSRGWRFPRNVVESEHSGIALPSEIAFSSQNPRLDSEGWPTEPRQLVPWEKIREDFGALLILDLASWKGVSVLCTREPLRRWTINLRFFPSGETPIEELTLGSDYGTSLNSYLQEVSPYALLGEDGDLERGWHCRSLLQAMYMMLFLDLTGGNNIRKCQSRGCPNYFRVGAQSKSKYCSLRHANRASTRMKRGQEP